MAGPRAIDRLQEKGWILPILDWMSRSEDIVAAAKVPYRMLEAVPELDGGDGDPVNMLIQGDNLDALKALLPFYAGRVKCIYIDPPFNTGQAFDDYDDNLEHSLWLAMMYPRLVLLRELLAEDGTFVLHLDDNEISYATVICDEIFGRKNRTYMVSFKQSAPKGHKVINPGMVTTTNYIVVYAKNKSRWEPNRGFVARERDKRYSSFISNFEDPIPEWKLTTVNKAFSATHNGTLNEVKKKLGKKQFEREIDEFVLANAHRVVQPVSPDESQVGAEIVEAIRFSEENPKIVHLYERDEGLPFYLKNGKRWLFYKDKLKEVDGRLAAAEALTNSWDDLLSNNIHNEGGVKFPKSKKPEKLIKRVFDLFSSPRDLVLDSFLGSGTTAAVAHKMNRTWIGIEMGKHAETHCKPRLDKVVEGEQGGISQMVDWQGGGGYRYYRLGPPAFDATGRIEPDIGFDALAAHIWFAETGQPAGRGDDATSPVLGLHDGTAYALLYNGILGDRRPEGGNVLTPPILADLKARLPDHTGPWVIYGEACKVPSERLKAANMTFKQTPYDVKAR